MKVNIYYGGRGVLDDPTQYVIQKMEKVLTELRVEVHRYNIYENKSMIATLPQTLKDVDGIVLATTIEWLGIGGCHVVVRRQGENISDLHAAGCYVYHIR